jgi:hypothetical protein
MSHNELSSDAATEAGEQDRLTALFSAMVLQQTQTALMLLGQVPDPRTGQSVVDLEAAQVFIDQLEMLEVKTRGNLTPQEEALLKQSLMTARMAFVEAVERPPTPQPAASQQAASSGPSAASGQTAPSQAQSPQGQGQANQPQEQADQGGPDHESRRRFFKKY